jgi:hypothetical protein
MPNGFHSGGWPARDSIQGHTYDPVIPFTTTQPTFLQHVVESVPPAGVASFLGVSALELYAIAYRREIANAALTYVAAGTRVLEPPAQEMQQQQLLHEILVPADNRQAFLPARPLTP